MIFISCSFDPFSMPYGQSVRSLFTKYGIDAFIAKHTAPTSLPEYLKTRIQQSEAVVALITGEDSPWQQTEITWAHEFKRPLFGIVQEGVAPRGILPYITVYRRFSPEQPETLNKAIQEIVASVFQIRESAKQEAAKRQQEQLIMGLAILALMLLLLTQSK